MAAESLAVIVGQRVRQSRNERGLSLSELARRSGLGKATLSDIEAGRRNPTLETLYALAAPLQVGLAALIAERPHTTVEGGVVTAVLLDVIHQPEASTEIYRFAIAPGEPRVSPSHGPGVLEQLTVVAGTAVVGPLGEEVRVATGATHSWLSDRPHSFAAESDREVVGVLVIRQPAKHPGRPRTTAIDGAGDENRTRVISLED